VTLQIKTPHPIATNAIPLIAPAINGAPALSLYDGRQFLGFLREIGGGRWAGLDRQRRVLGTYASRVEAADAVEAAATKEESAS
jgi:hypothetical protein